jgi:hypothetical protein
MMDVHVPAGWPEAVAPPGSEDFETSAVAWMLDELVPYLRTDPVRRYPKILAVIASHIAAGAVQGARDGFRTVRTELDEAVPPHAVDEARRAYLDEGRRLAAAAKAADLVKRALLGEAV